MKLFPNKDKVRLFTRSMGKLLEITAIFDSDDDANEYMAKHSDQGVISCSGSLVMLANLHDKGERL